MSTLASVEDSGYAGCMLVYHAELAQNPLLAKLVEDPDVCARGLVDRMLTKGHGDASEDSAVCDVRSV